jgi:hypothetical protein
MHIVDWAAETSKSRIATAAAEMAA